MPYKFVSVILWDLRNIFCLFRKFPYSYSRQERLQTEYFHSHIFDTNFILSYWSFASIEPEQVHFQPVRSLFSVASSAFSIGNDPLIFRDLRLPQFVLFAFKLVRFIFRFLNGNSPYVHRHSATAPTQEINSPHPFILHFIEYTSYFQMFAHRKRNRGNRFRFPLPPPIGADLIRQSTEECNILKNTEFHHNVLNVLSWSTAVQAWIAPKIPMIRSSITNGDERQLFARCTSMIAIFSHGNTHRNSYWSGRSKLREDNDNCDRNNRYHVFTLESIFATVRLVYFSYAVQFCA